MGFLKNFINKSASRPTEAERALYLYVQCDKCGEKLRARVDIYSELTPDFAGNSDTPTAYFCRKVLIGEKQCYLPIELRLKFDKNHRLSDQQISGGKFIDKLEYDQEN